MGGKDAGWKTGAPSNALRLLTGRCGVKLSKELKMIRLFPKTYSLVILLVILLAVTALAVDDPVDLLPRDHEVGSWVKDGPEGVYFGFSLDRILDDNVRRVVEDYGLASLLSQYYILDSDHIEIRIYEMTSPEQAYGLYSVFADIEPKPEDTGISIQEKDITKTRTVPQEMYVVSETEVYLLGDNFFVWIFAYQPGHPIDLMMFANKIQNKFNSAGGNISGMKPLEREDKIFGSERLIGGYNALGLYLQVGNFDPFLLGQEGVRCLQADYRLKSGKLFRQLVISYPDEEVSKQAYSAFTKWTEDFNYLKRVNYADTIGSVVAKSEDGRYIAGFRDGVYLRVFYSFESLDEVKTILASYMRRA